MSRLTIAPALLTLGFLPACGNADVDDGVFDEHDALELVDGEDADAPPASTELSPSSAPSTAPLPVVLAPRLDCGGLPCIPGGTGSTPLKGRDEIRAAYFDVVGYPDQETFRSHSGEGHRAVYEGAWGAAFEQLVRSNAMMTEAGVGSCDDSPESGSISVTNGRVEFSDGGRIIPDRFIGAEKRLEHHVDITETTFSLDASIDYSCDYAIAYGEFQFVLDGREHHTKAWWSAPERGELEIELVSRVGDFVHAAALQTDSRGVDAALVTVHDVGPVERGTRTLLSSDAEGRAATGYRQHLVSEDGLFGVRDAFETDLKGVELGSDIQCASWTAYAPQHNGGPCEGLDVTRPLPSVFDASEYSIGWAAAPVGQNGARDVLAKDL